MDERITVEIDGRTLTLTNLSKPLFPETGHTKARILDYYRQVAPAMLPHLKARPLTFTRYPHGTGDMSFFAKNVPAGAPPWLETSVVHSHRSGTPVEYPRIEHLASLMWAVNLAAFELHAPLHTVAAPDEPTMAVFDLDPGAPATIVECCQVALLIRDVLDTMGFQAFPRTSGGKGFHLYLPLNTPATYEAVRDFTHAVALLLAQRHPDRIVAGQNKDHRKGKVFIDWHQNHTAKTMVAPYSLRGTPAPVVSTPVTWDEVEAMAVPGSGAPLRYLVDDLPARLDRHGDLFASIHSITQELPALAVRPVVH